MKKLFEDTLKKSILVLDGALDGNVGRYKLVEKEYRGDKDFNKKMKKRMEKANTKSKELARKDFFKY